MLDSRLSLTVCCAGHCDTVCDRGHCDCSVRPQRTTLRWRISLPPDVGTLMARCHCRCAVVVSSTGRLDDVLGVAPSTSVIPPLASIHWLPHALFGGACCADGAVAVWTLHSIASGRRVSRAVLRFDHLLRAPLCYPHVSGVGYWRHGTRAQALGRNTTNASAPR